MNEVVWITGASSGIGEAFAVEYARLGGCSLVLSGRKDDALDRVRQACIDVGLTASDVLVMPFDIVDVAGHPQRVSEVLAQYGRIDVLINNAGISQRSWCVDTNLDVYRTLFEVDVFGQIALTKAVLPIMLDQESGHIAVTSSVAGKLGAPLRTGYSMAKHAVMGFLMRCDVKLRTKVSMYRPLPLAACNLRYQSMLFVETAGHLVLWTKRLKRACRSRIAREKLWQS